MFPTLPAYTGPYRSDGKFQTSVPFGKTPPSSHIEWASRLHDTMYAFYPNNLAAREAADRWYHRQVSSHGDVGKFLGGAVLSGNQNLRGRSRNFRGTEPHTNIYDGFYDRVMREIVRRDNMVKGAYAPTDNTSMNNRYFEVEVTDDGQTVYVPTPKERLRDAAAELHRAGAGKGAASLSPSPAMSIVTNYGDDYSATGDGRLLYTPRIRAVPAHRRYARKRAVARR